MNAMGRLCGALTVKIGHCEIQLGPLGVKAGQYQIAKKNILRTENK
jgi:hypothetical protein